MAFSEVSRLGFSPGTPVSSPPSWVNVSANKNKAKTNAMIRSRDPQQSVSLFLLFHGNSCCFGVVVVPW